ncbi:MAG: hypothetical protein MR392_06265 [Roseburia sp.]|nr:hypothetical protein [Roseburia sp.]
MEKQSMKEIVSTVIKAIALAMGVAVVVLSCLGQMQANTSVVMLGMGLACAGIALLKRNDEEDTYRTSISKT